MNEKHSLIIVASVLIAAACGTPPSPGPEASCQVRYLLNEIGDTLFSFRYSEDLLVDKKRFDPMQTHQYLYEDSRLVKEEILDQKGTLNTYLVYTYNAGGKIEKISTWDIEQDGSSVQRGYTDYVYENSPSITRTKTYDTRVFPTIQVAEVSYSWNPQNQIREKINYQQDPFNPDGIRAESRQIFSYDQQNNPFFAQGLPVLSEDDGAHNLIRELFTAFVYSQSGKDTSFVSVEAEAEYTYNEEGYPTRAARTSFNGNLDVTLFGYKCE